MFAAFARWTPKGSGKAIRKPLCRTVPHRAGDLGNSPVRCLQVVQGDCHALIQQDLLERRTFGSQFAPKRGLAHGQFAADFDRGQLSRRISRNQICNAR
jgi:hypothetical protein